MSSINPNTINVNYIKPEVSSSYISSDGKLILNNLPKRSSDLEILLDSAAPKLMGDTYKLGNGKLLRNFTESPLLDSYLNPEKGTRAYIDFNASEKYLSAKITRNKMAELASAYQTDMYNASKLN